MMATAALYTPPSLYAPPARGASLMLAFRPQRTLVLGSNTLAATRANSALEADSLVTVLSCSSHPVGDELRWRADRGELQLVDLDSFSPTDSIAAFASYLNTQRTGETTLLFVTDTLIVANGDRGARRSLSSARKIYDLAHQHGISVNTADIPELCDFTVCASHRFAADDSGSPSSLQVGVTTNGQGCRLATRIRREIVASLPREVGYAAARIGELRQLAKARVVEEDDGAEETEESTPNRPVEPLMRAESETEKTRRRMRWVSQLSEYWSYPKLASLTRDEMLALLDSSLSPPASATHAGFSQHGLDIPVDPPSKKGRVLLVGSGPGHPSLLSLAAHAALTSHADVVLTDKLVPAGVLALIPSHIPTVVARKFPGNADRAQEELMQLALEGAREGKTVVRLKQGDPALYGRVGEELLFLRKHGVPTVVVPGISSALAAPLVAGIPVTQRGAADSVVVCTGVGRGGKRGNVPPYERGRTVVLLMGNARLASIVDALLVGGRYPAHLPTAIVERATMPDQRVLTTRLDTIVEALESLGEQRPPGLLIIGWAVCSLEGTGNLNLLGDGPEGTPEADRDEEAIKRWMGDRMWRVEEGISPLWEMFVSSNVQATGT